MFLVSCCFLCSVVFVVRVVCYFPWFCFVVLVLFGVPIVLVFHCYVVFVASVVLFSTIPGILVVFCCFHYSVVLNAA